MLEYVTFNENNIMMILNALEVKTVQEHDNIIIVNSLWSMCMLSSSSHLQKLSKQGTFPKVWEKANLTLIYKKGGKSLVKNYKPVLLLPIGGIIFKRIIYNSLHSLI